MDNSLTREQVDLAYLDTFEKHRPGVVVLDHLHRLYYDTDGFDPDPYKHAFKTGQRSVVRHILQRMYVASHPTIEEISE